jgi:death-on-curing protein
MNEPIFLTHETVREIHRYSLQEHGGLDGLRDPGLLESALMQPEAAYFYGQGDLAAIAAAYAFHIAQNQPFTDGNKRTAITCALTFLDLNGTDPSRFDGPTLYDAKIGIAEKRLDKAGLAAMFRTALGS